MRQIYYAFRFMLIDAGLALRFRSTELFGGPHHWWRLAESKMRAEGRWNRRTQGKEKGK